MSSPVAVVLAAGKSTRMKSDLPKVLHEVCGRPMIDYVLDAARAAGVGRLVVIVGHAAEQVKAARRAALGMSADQKKDAAKQLRREFAQLDYQVFERRTVRALLSHHQLQERNLIR